MKKLTAQEMQKKSTQNQIKKYGGIKGYRAEMKRRSLIKAEKKLSTDSALREVVEIVQ